MTSWVMTLNEVSPELERLLPPTDTRLRADIRAVENGIYDQVCSTFLHDLWAFLSKVVGLSLQSLADHL